MAERIKLVQGDTRPQIVISCKNQLGAAIPFPGGSVKLYFRAEGSSTLLQTINGTLLAGFVNDDGSITSTAPYDVDGSGGRASFNRPAGALNVDAGNYEGEIEITFADGTIQTVFDVLKFKVRADF
jgi:hypothetical protein